MVVINKNEASSFHIFSHTLRPIIAVRDLPNELKIQIQNSFRHYKYNFIIRKHEYYVVYFCKGLEPPDLAQFVLIIPTMWYFIHIECIEGRRIFEFHFSGTLPGLGDSACLMEMVNSPISRIARQT